MKSGPPRIVQLTETGSTNRDALRLAAAGEPLPLWVVADRQTAGRGRSGRTWVSIPGNLFASLAIVTHAPLAAAGQLALVAGVALFEAVRANTPLEIVRSLRLKWPNDLLIGHRKAGGILVESFNYAQRDGAIAVIGFGLNIVSQPDDLDRPVTSLRMHGSAAQAGDLLASLVEKCDTWIGTWDSARGFADVRTAWLERAGPIGEPVTVHMGETRIKGTFQGLTDSGALLVDVGGRRETINYGDVSLDREAPPSDGG